MCTGTIPEEVGKLSERRQLAVDNNDLSGDKTRHVILHLSCMCRTHAYAGSIDGIGLTEQILSNGMHPITSDLLTAQIVPGQVELLKVAKQS